MKKLNVLFVLLMIAVFLSAYLYIPDWQSFNVETDLYIKQDENAGTITIYRKGAPASLLSHRVAADARPFIQTLAAPDGRSILAARNTNENKGNTGLFLGLTDVNGRDFFSNAGAKYWKRISSGIVEEKGAEVKWQVVYDMLGADGSTLITETQNWTARQDSGKYIVSVEWKGEAKTDINVGKNDRGGLFLGLPEGSDLQVVNAARQQNEKADGQRAMWVDIGLALNKSNSRQHVAVFDHPQNKGYPLPWNVDMQKGVGTARSSMGAWNIKKGETEVIRHQLIIYPGNLDDVKLTAQWEKFSGKSSLYSTIELWKIAQQEGLEAKFLTPEEAVKTMTLKAGYKVNAWAAEPLMTQPMAFCWDDRGRIWIAENRDYESRSYGFSNSGDSRILILEDTNHDGKADTRKVFMEGIAFPAALAVGFDGVFVGAPPNLLFIPDRNHDDVADTADIEVRLTGWGIRDRHETLNSFHWGPDGWLYGCQGFATPSVVRKPEGKGRLYKHKEPFPENKPETKGTDINGGVWRYHPTKDIFEVVAHGFSNPWGIDFDAKGQLFISACVIPHMWHVIPGGIYHRQGGQHFNPYVYDDIKTITDHSHRSAHGGARVYQSDAFPASQRGRIFMANIHEHAVLSDVLTPKGSGFVASHGDDFMMANNAQWVGFSMEVGPDGGLFVLDWHDADICGQKVLNTETGRIFRIVPEKSLAPNFTGRYADLSKMPDHDLVNLQTSESDWHSRRARIILQSRAAKKSIDSKTISQLTAIYQTDANTDYRLRALWTLHVIDGLSQDVLSHALSDENEYVRAWAIQLSCEDRYVPPSVTAELILMAKHDPSPVVRLYLASALQRLDEFASWKIAGELVKHGEDMGDHNLPKMIWYGLEPLVRSNPAKALQLVRESNIPMLAKFVARRAVDGGAMSDLVKAIGSNPKTQLSLLEGMLSAMEGRTDLKAPAEWQKVATALTKSSGRAAQLAREIAELFGDTEAVQRSLVTLKNANAPVDQRRKALQALTAQQQKELVKQLPSLLEENQLRLDAILSIAAFDDEKLGQLLIKRYQFFTTAEKTAAIQTLSSRSGYGWALAQAIKNNTIARKDIPVTVARQLRRVVGSGFVEIWGPIDDVPRDDKLLARYKQLVSEHPAATADHRNGQRLFQTTCGSCHKMYGQGGVIGPDLTGSNRTNTDYLLFNILNPSEEIQEDYKMVVVTTRDGRVYSGNVIAENQRQLTMRVVGQDAVVINKSSIQSREVTPVSMMPQGLLTALSDKEVVDLLAYLRTAGK